MKFNRTGLDEMKMVYSHPSAIFFRAIELRTIFENCRDWEFQQPTLDLGCGDGTIARLLSDESFTFGVDNGEAQDVQEAIDKGVYSRVFLESAERMSLPDESVNLVFSNCVIEHIPDNEAVLSEVQRILRPGGSFIFTVPSHLFPDYLYLTDRFRRYRLSFLADRYKNVRNDRLKQFHCYDVNEWSKRLDSQGFRIINYKYYMPKSSLMLWDKMALEVYLRSFFDRQAEHRVAGKYEKHVMESYQKSDVLNDEGAGLFIHCQK